MLLCELIRIALWRMNEISSFYSLYFKMNDEAYLYL